MTPKQLRTIERELHTLFSQKAFIQISTLEGMKKYGLFRPTINAGTAKVFLSEKCIASLRNVSKILASDPRIVNQCTVDDAYSETVKNYEHWINSYAQPQATTFSNDIIESIQQKIKHYYFAVRIIGLLITDSNSFPLGAIKIQEIDDSFCRTLDIKEHLAEDQIQEEFSSDYILTGEAQGTATVARDRFYLHTLLCVGILAVYGTILYKHTFSNSRVRALTGPQDGYETTHLLSWENGGTNVALSTSWGFKPPLAFTQNDINYFTDQCFLQHLCALLNSEKRSDLEEAIIRSLYWFSEAYRDATATMRFIKLWSAAECFFALNNEHITEANATGIATLLVFSGYGIEKPENHGTIKSRIKKLYALRSKAIHHAEFSHIDMEHVTELSYWIAWVIISMVSLTQKGFKTPKEVYERTLHLESKLKQ